MARRKSLGAVQLADLAGDVALEQANPDDQREQREQEQAFKRHQEMANRHHDCARQQSGAAAKPAVGDQTARNRGEIDQTGIVTIDCRGERLAFLAAIGRALQPLQPQNPAHIFGQQQILGHV
jgi:hemolysin activation/secretion protein